MVIPDAVGTLERELRGVFGTRLKSLVLYGHRAHTLEQARREHSDAHGHGHDAAPLRTLAVGRSWAGTSPDPLRPDMSIE